MFGCPLSIRSVYIFWLELTESSPTYYDNVSIRSSFSPPIEHSLVRQRWFRSCSRRSFSICQTLPRLVLFSPSLGFRRCTMSRCIIRLFA